MVPSVNSRTYATRIGWYPWEIHLRFALGLPQGWRWLSASHDASSLRSQGKRLYRWYSCLRYLSATVGRRAPAKTPGPGPLRLLRQHRVQGPCGNQRGADDEADCVLVGVIRCRVNSAQLRLSRPDSGLGLSHFFNASGLGSIQDVSSALISG